MQPSPRRNWWAGALTPWVILCGLTALLAVYCPDFAGIGTLARIADNLAPHLILAALAGTLVLALLRASRRVLILCAAITIVSAGVLVGRHLDQVASILPEREADLRLLWFNVLNDNPTPPDRLVAALAESPADIIILAEAKPLQGHLDALAATFPHRAGCEGRECEVMVLSRIPLARAVVHRTGRLQEQRLAVAVVELPGRAPLKILGMQLIKPWFIGFSERDEWHAIHAMGLRGGPLVAIGDFNAAPWGRRIQTMVTACGMAPVRLPPPTWPVSAGPLGVPIDNALVRGGARLTSLETWGRGLGSNHLGLLAGIALPGPGNLEPVPESCVPPDD